MKNKINKSKEFERKVEEFFRAKKSDRWIDLVGVSFAKQLQKSKLNKSKSQTNK